MPDIQPSEALIEKRQPFAENSGFLKDVMELARDGDARSKYLLGGELDGCHRTG